MPYLKMFLGEQQIDEVFISEILLNSVLSLYIMDEEKQNMLKRNESIIRNEKLQPVFWLDSVPSAGNDFQPLKLKKDKD